MGNFNLEVNTVNLSIVSKWHAFFDSQGTTQNSISIIAAGRSRGYRLGA